MPSQVQITKHNCVQGWCGVAKWKGVRLADVLDLAGPLPAGRYIKLTSWGWPSTPTATSRWSRSTR